MTNSTDTIPIYLDWFSVEPDSRQYKPVKPVFTPINVKIVVLVPLTDQYLFNVIEIKAAMELGAKLPAAVLTLEGMAYCENELLAAKYIAKMYQEQKEAEAAEDDDWDIDKETVLKDPDKRENNSDADFSWDSEEEKEEEFNQLKEDLESEETDLGDDFDWGEE